MKITESLLRQITEEELGRVVRESMLCEVMPTDLTREEQGAYKAGWEDGYAGFRRDKELASLPANSVYVTGYAVGAQSWRERAQKG